MYFGNQYLLTVYINTSDIIIRLLIRKHDYNLKVNSKNIRYVCIDEYIYKSTVYMHEQIAN